jgi:molybdate transport system ATP-binding protein
MEEPFETILHFRYAGQSDGSPAVWWRLSKEKRPQEFPKELGVAAANILLLYE